MKRKINFKKIAGLWFTLLLVVLLSAAVSAFELDVESGILIEAETGQVLYEKNADLELPPASITKIMPMLMAMENIENGQISLQDEVLISNYASSMGGSQIFLAANTAVPVEKLLKAVTIASANDASVALSEYLSGTYSSFIHEMNQRAAELGMVNTNFVNSTGLPAENHYTTARDITKMAREIVQYDLILEWGQIWDTFIQLPNREARLTNTNQLINYYPGVDGIKTGYTSEAGYCLTATARRNDYRLISVVMRTESKEERRELTTRLLNFGFNNFSREILFAEGEEIQNIEIAGAKDRHTTGVISEDLIAMIRRGEKDKFSTQFSPEENLKAPLSRGDLLGEMVVEKEGEVINSVQVVVAEDVDRANIFVRLWRSFVNWIGGLLQSF